MQMWICRPVLVQGARKSLSAAQNLRARQALIAKSFILKSRRADLNRWPADYESAALPAELRRQKNAHHEW